MTRFNEVGFESEAEHSNDVVGLGMRCDFLDTFGLGFDLGDGDGDGPGLSCPCFFKHEYFWIVSVQSCHISGVFIIFLLNSGPRGSYLAL